MAENRCKSCNCLCHCSVLNHSDMLGICPCQMCKCDGKKEATQILNDKYGVPSNNEYVVDSTGECETCQQTKQNVVIRIPKKKKNQVRVVKQKKKTTQKR